MFNFHKNLRCLNEKCNDPCMKIELELSWSIYFRIKLQTLSAREQVRNNGCKNDNKYLVG